MSETCIEGFCEKSRFILGREFILSPGLWTSTTPYKKYSSALQSKLCLVDANTDDPQTLAFSFQLPLVERALGPCSKFAAKLLPRIRIPNRTRNIVVKVIPVALRKFFSGLTAFQPQFSH